MNKRFILASKSPARKVVFEKLGLPFEVIVSNFEEDMTLPLSAPELALHLSQGKAMSLARDYPEAIIIAADTFVVFNDRFLGKPKDEADAKNMLMKLAGNTHTILTGLTVIENDRKVSEVAHTKVTMKNLSEDKINEYVATGEPLGKSGSYAIQGEGRQLIEKIEGEYFNIMGMPLKMLTKILNEKFLVPVYFSENDPAL
jgi:septum formation protein